MSTQRIAELERDIAERIARLNDLRKSAPPRQVPDYRFATLDGEATLSDLFAGRRRLLAIHNMGQGCRFCTLWADGFNRRPGASRIRHGGGPAVAGPAPPATRLRRLQELAVPPRIP